MGVQTVNLGAMTWNDGLAAAAGYGFAGVTSINAKDLAFTFTDEQKKGLSKESNMALVSDATGLTAGKTVTNPTVTQTVSYDVNGAALSGTLTGTVSTAAGAVNYAATGMTLDSVDLAKWDGATASAVPAGWTKNDSGVTVATENMNNLPETSKVILVTDTANYFSDAKISETNKYKAYDFTPSAANGVTLSGKQSKGVRTAENGKKLEYAVGKMDVSEISFGTMDWGTSRAATMDYDFAKVATVNASDLAFNFTNEQKADLSGTSTMTLLSDATNLAADKTVTGASRSQQIDYSVANGADLTGTLTGTVSTAAGAVNYNATSMTLDSVDLANWDGATTSAVPTGWTAADKSVAVNNADAITVTPTKTQAILTAESGMFQDVNVAKTPVAFDPVTENGVTLTGTKTNSIQTTKTKVDNDTVSYVVGKKDVKSIAIGAIEWGGKALDGSSADYNYEAASVDSSKFDISNPEKVEANVAKILLEANDTLKDMTKDVNASYNDYEVTTGVLMNGMITGSLSKSGNNIVFAAAENKATDLTFGKVEWTGSNPLVDHSKVKTSEFSVWTENKGMKLDFGAVAKGYAADKVIKSLKDEQANCEYALLNLCGTVAAYGKKPEGGEWKIGITDPDNTDTYMGTVSCTDKIIATSGSYERYFEGDDGKIYSHIIDPKTGYPVDNGIKSVTVISDSGLLSDGLSTALFVMGLDKAKEYYQSRKDFDFIILTDDKKAFVTAGAAESFTQAAGYEYETVII